MYVEVSLFEPVVKRRITVFTHGFTILTNILDEIEVRTFSM